VRHAIESDIVSGKFLPGAKLDEEGLASRYGASRTPVREALKHLASQGLIELRPHAGAFVAQLTVADLAEMFETMAYLEAACAALASRRHTAADRDALNAAHQACAKAARKGDPDTFYSANARFHETIYAASHNGYLESETVSLRNRLEAYRREATFHPGLISMTMAEHERILQAIFAMDDALAATLMRSHLDTLRDDAVSMARAVRRASSAN
jgi:DNA-binding GntR family transcriptional regulator